MVDQKKQSSIPLKSEEQSNVSYYEVPTNHIHTIHIELFNEQYAISTHDKDYCLIEGKMLTTQNYELSVTNKEMFFKRNDHHTISREPYGEGEDLTILLPKDILLRTLTFSSKSGEGTIENIDADEIDITTTTGEMSLQDMKASNFTLHTTSTDVKLAQLTAANASIHTINADVDLSHIKITNALRLQSVEGDIDLEEGYAQELFFETESGDFSGKEFYPNTISFQSIEGDLILKNKEKKHDIIIKSKQTIDGEMKIKT